MRLRLLLVCLTGLAVGCGDGRQVGTVSGRVTLDGQPLADARVNFQPVGDARNTGIGSFGKTDANGDYSLTLIDEKGQGAIVGTHRVMIKAVPAGKGDPTDDKARAGGDRVPPAYNTNSTLTFEVKPGHNTADWKLETKTKKTR
jgi:hypothetical protein